MTIRHLVQFLLNAFLFSGCINDSGSDTITGDYEAIWIDIPQSRGISKGEGIVPAYVSEIGHDSRYIIAKQHPIKRGSTVSIQTDTTNYYIIEITDNSFQDKPVYGPLEQKAFDSLMRELEITGIKFDKKYPVYQ